jgi:hypothetical protein
MRTAHLLAPCLALILVACGRNGAPEPGAPGTFGGKPREAPSGDASAEQVAEESRGDVDCPADIDTPARAASAPVDDVLGVRPGLTFDEAANVVLCTHDLLVASPPSTQGFNIKTWGATIRQGFSARFAEPRVVKTSKQIMQEMQDEMIARSGNAVRREMMPGQSRWYVSTMGLPGEERVIAAAREEWFAEGRNPTMQSVADALIKKYGQPTRHQVAPHVISLVWMHDPQGRFVPETSPLANQCVAMSSPNGGSNFSPDCGLVVAAMVWPLRDNPALSEHFEVGVADQANGYELIVGTEQALEKQEMARRQQQVDDAAKNADGPQL